MRGFTSHLQENPPPRPLSPEQKSFDNELSKAGEAAEHTISRLKKFNIVGQKFRNKQRFYDTMKDLVSDMINARITAGR